MHSEYASF